MLRHHRLLLPLAFLAVVVTGCSGLLGGSAGGGSGGATGGGSAPASSAVATSVQNGIELKATFANANRALPGGELVFSFVLDNHAIDLDNLDLANKAALRPADGEPVTQGFRWRQEGSGHHATGVLSLDNRDDRGKPLVTAATPYIILELQDVGKPGVHALRFENKGWKLP